MGHRGSGTRLGVWLGRPHGRHGHPGVARLSRYVDADLPVWEHDVIREHLRDCVSCRRLARSLSQTVVGLRSLRAGAPSQLSETIIAALRRTTSNSRAARLTVVSAEPAATLAHQRRGVRVAIRYCLQRSYLRFTVPTGLLVGTMLSIANKGTMLLHGQIDLQMCVVCGLDYFLPFVAMNVVLLTATRLARRR